jgi:hypothetical protein
MLNTSQSFSSWLLDLHPKSAAQAPKSPDDLGLPAPEITLCPRCGACAKRNQLRVRRFWEPNLVHACVLEIQAGCYICPCCQPGSRWFMLLPADYQTSSQYSVLARTLVVDLVQKHKMPAEQAAAWARERLHLVKLDAATVLRWLRASGETVDSAARLKAVLAVFSGQISLDEVYDGGWYQLKATDPLNGIEIAWKLERGQPTRDDVRQFLLEIKAAGFEPEIVSTDGCDLYPDVLAEVWPGAGHQRCAFHFIKQVNEDLSKAFWQAYETMPVPPKRRRGRPKKRGRPRADRTKRENRERVRKARWLLLKRQSNLSAEEQERLDEAIGLCPPLGVLRRFVVQLHDLFGPTTDSHGLAEERRRAILDDAEFQAFAGLAQSLGRLGDDDLFARLTRYLDFENADKTSNHVERENREFRKRQRTHYRMRSRRSLCALAEFLRVRRPVPAVPTKLRRRTNAEEARTA